MPAPTRRTRRRAQEFDPQEYAAFIRQIELVQVWLDRAEIRNDHGPHSPGHTTIDVESSATFSQGEDEFRVLQSYDLCVLSEELLAEVEVTFGLRFLSKKPMTEDFFNVFEEVNLPVNTWPFLREFVSSTLGRMGWQPVTLPALKRGTEPAKQKGEEPTKSGTRSRRASVRG